MRHNVYFLRLSQLLNVSGVADQGRNYAWAWGAQVLPKRRRSPSNWDGNRSFWHCCFGHHFAVIEGYLFVVLCVIGGGVPYSINSLRALPCYVVLVADHLCYVKRR